MQIRIPPVRITLHGIKVEECDIKEKLRGGGKQTFILVGGENKTYEAKKPHQAALKAFYAISRFNKKHDYKKELSDLEKKMVDNNIGHLNSKLTTKYMDALLNNTMESEGEVIELQKTNKNKVYRYNVKYECNLNPNKHELEHCITRKAVAKKI